MKVAKHQTQLGIILAFLGTGAMGLMDACMKWLTAEYPVGQIVFCRSIFALLPLYVWMRLSIPKAKFKKSLKVHNWPYVIGRALISFIAFTCFVIAFAEIPLAEATAISYSMPLFSTVLAIFFLSERLTKHRLISLTAGFLGMLIIIRPGAGVFQMGAFYALFGSFMFAIFRVLTRYYGNSEKTEALTLWVIITWSVCSLISLTFGWKMPVGHAIGILVVIGILGGLVEILITKSCQIAPASVTSMVQYSLLIWATTYDLLIWNRLPDIYTVIGVVVVILSTIFLTLKERKLSPRPPE